MRVLSLYVGQEEKDAKEMQDVAFVSEVNYLGFFYRSITSDTLRFMSALIAQRTPKGSRRVIDNEEGNSRVVVQSYQDVAIAVTTDREYPLPAAWRLIHEIREISFSHQDHKESLQSLQSLLHNYQDPTFNDKISRIQGTLDEIKCVMEENIKDILKRGESIETLVDKSEKLKDSSKIFIKEAKRQNQCCKAW